MRIKAGEAYKMRNGQAIIVLANDCEVRPWRDERCKYTWADSGHVYSEKMPTDFDLVSTANEKLQNNQ